MNNQKQKTIKKILIIIAASLKAIWNSTVKIAWGLCAIFLLAGLIKGMSIDASRITYLLTMSVLLRKNWVVFWIAFLLRDLYY